MLGLRATVNNPVLFLEAHYNINMAKEESNFNNDNKASIELGKFIEKHFYSEMRREGKISSYTCFYGDDDESREMQKEGVDVSLQFMNKSREITLLIDEKSQLSYVNDPVPSFILELQFLKRKSTEVADGWFVRDDLKTEYYEFMWIHADPTGAWLTRKQPENVKEEDFRLVYLMRVEKKALRKYLEGAGLGIKELVEQANEIRRSKAEDPDGPIENNPGFPLHYSYTDYLPEKPINLVVPISFLYAVPKSAVYAITKDGYEKLDSCPDVKADYTLRKPASQ